MGDIIFGVHTGPSNVSIDELRAAWRRIESLPFDWISIWDHLYGADGTSTNNFDAIAVHTALALTTERVTCGSLVYCAGYRHPAILAKAMATIDHLSGGRCSFGIGSGWARYEFEPYGIEYRRTKDRLDVMEESLICIERLLHQSEDDGFTFDGAHFQMNNAVNHPRPLQDRLPIFVGGGGERRTLALAAKYADGWNIPYVSPDVFAHKNSVLDDWCEKGSRAPGEIRRSINVGYASGEAALQRQFGTLSNQARDGVLMGSTNQIVDAIGRFVDAGADQINLALRAPFEYAALDAVADAVTQFQSAS